MRPFGYIVASAAAVLVGCTEPKDAYSRIQTPPVALISPYESFQPQNDVLARIRSTGRSITVLDDVKLSPGDPRPRYESYDIEVPDQEFCGQRGILRIYFFNQRLSSTTFYPSQAEKCFAQLPFPELRSGKGEVTRGDTVIATGIDYRDRPYVAYHDRRLISELDRWVARYS